MKNHQFVIATSSENEYLFNNIDERFKIIVLRGKSGRLIRLELLVRAIIGRFSFIYPYWQKTLFSRFGVKEIYWFADFQECYFPQFYDQNQLSSRQQLISQVVDTNRPIILSSQSSWDDLKKYYGSDKNARLMPFVSYIEQEIKTIDTKFEIECRRKYDIEKPYVCICNQFWQHKNHIVIFQAIAELVKRNKCNINFVFTGKMEDYRNPQYIDSLKKVIRENKLEQFIKVLGFVDRTEQIAIMKCSEFLIQPSLFEGWGTVVEDAKVLDKTILLSDIPVHHEQMNEKCGLFDPHNANALADLIEQEILIKHVDSAEKGIADMRRRATVYSLGFEDMLSALNER